MKTRHTMRSGRQAAESPASEALHGQCSAWATWAGSKPLHTALHALQSLSDSLQRGASCTWARCLLPSLSAAGDQALRSPALQRQLQKPLAAASCPLGCWSLRTSTYSGPGVSLAAWQWLAHVAGLYLSAVEGSPRCRTRCRSLHSAAAAGACRRSPRPHLPLLQAVPSCRRV